MPRLSERKRLRIDRLDSLEVEALRQSDISCETLKVRVFSKEEALIWQL